MSIRAYSVGRNGMPERVNYVYRGTGEDTLTGDLADYALEPYRRDEQPFLAPCGTPAAYRRHIRRCEFIDEACKAAVRAENDYYKARRQAAS